MNGIRDINQPDPDTGLGPFSTKFPYLGSILVLSNLYKSNYNGLQATLQQRTAHGLSFLASYTYSHSLDDDSYNIGQFLPQDSNNPALEYGEQRLRHKTSLHVFGHLRDSGKECAGTTSARMGAQFRCNAADRPARYGNDQSNGISGTGENTDRWDFFGNPGDFKSGNSSIPYCTGAWDRRLHSNHSQSLYLVRNPLVASPRAIHCLLYCLRGGSREGGRRT